MSGRLKVSEGDWVCTAEGCDNLNFARREKCNKCGEPKEPSMLIKNAGTEIGARFAEKSKGLFSANDWQCSKCGNINWARRTTCNVCNAPKIGPEEQRTGYGGGFKENENVTYKEKEDSDGEFDEFGRKKKKYRGKVPAVETIADNAAAAAAAVAAGQVKVVVGGGNANADEEEDDDEDDDDDVDLSKYALSDDSDTENTGKDKKGGGGSRSSSSSSGSSSGDSRGDSRGSRRSRSRSRSPRKQQSKRSRSRSPMRRSRSPVRRSRSPVRRSKSRSPGGYRK